MKKIGIVIAAITLSLAWYFVVFNTRAVILTTIADDKAKIGETIKVEINLKNTTGSEVSALEFALNYDKDIFVNPQIKEGAVLKLAQKNAVSDVSPEKGAIKVVIFGANQNSIENGKILEVSFKVKAEAKPTKTSIVIDKIVTASPDAQAIKSRARAKNINII